MKPVTISENNTPIPAGYDGKAGKGNCACGGKGCKNKHHEEEQKTDTAEQPQPKA